MSTEVIQRFQQTDHEIKGWLQKWTNYLKGYQKRWFVLSNGLLSYYRNPMEMSQSCRGTISLVSAVIHTEDSCNFVIANGGTTQTFHLRAANEIERQKWVTALELAKVRAIRLLDSEDDDVYDMNSDKNELQTVLKCLATKLETLHTCHDVIIKHGSALQRSLIELEQLDNPNDSLNKSKTVNERATLFRITSSAMINASAEYLTLAQTHAKKWQKLLQHEHESRLRLEELVEQLAKQHSHLEQKAIKQVANSNPNNASNASDDEEFYDAEETNSDFIVSFPGKAHRIGSSAANSQSMSKAAKQSAISSSDSSASASVLNNHSDESSGSGDDSESGVEESAAGVIQRKKSRQKNNLNLKDLNNANIITKVVNHSTDGDSTKSLSTPTTPAADRTNPLLGEELNSGKRLRRKTIPERPNQSLNLWSFMKNCIGKELTKVPMPVNFNEPLSMLQRLTEDYEYADLLHKASKVRDSCEQLTYIAAFSVTSYATTSNRTGKPFNPLLGETYECDRSEDLGWKCFSEQVSHHPPALAQYCEGRGWKCWREFSISSKFRGKYLQITPLDITHLEFESSGNHYTWKKVTTTVHNIIVGKLWVDNHGDMTITNHTTGDKCHLKFIPYSYFSRDVPRKVTGVVMDSEGTPKWVLQGTWDNKVEASKVINSHGSAKGKPILETATPKVIWKRVYPPSDYERMYNMTLLAVQLNEPESGVAPTDSRVRPDQRLMEAGKWDEANSVKGALEEKQRSVRRYKEEEAEKAATEGRPYMPYEPIWFSKKKDPITGNPVHIYTGEYWRCKERQDWSKCPQIFKAD
ncbi:unnamed protein product [Medioppia subpectinata]|uniref:PH domain-containing protein n=1 Tax=Medioppia subpectinata TaxID=1979941 RepID=A0A7R9KVG2_9ACAR|nr:unnamed protein product [Medioppia subpectinata]CAG2110463.1 unnamed protein product [Medioppia subpectinata]